MIHLVIGETVGIVNVAVLFLSGGGGLAIDFYAGRFICQDGVKISPAHVDLHSPGNGDRVAVGKILKAGHGPVGAEYIMGFINFQRITAGSDFWGKEILRHEQDLQPENEDDENADERHYPFMIVLQMESSVKQISKGCVFRMNGSYIYSISVFVRFFNYVLLSYREYTVTKAKSKTASQLRWMPFLPVIQESKGSVWFSYCFRSSLGVQTETRVPLSITKMRSPSLEASFRSWVIKTMVRSSSRRIFNSSF